MTDHYSVELEWADGFRASFVQSWIAPAGEGFTGSSLRVLGEEGGFDFATGSLTFRDRTEPRRTIQPGPQPDTRLALEAFLASVRSDSPLPPPLTLADARPPPESACWCARPWTSSGSSRSMRSGRKRCSWQAGMRYFEKLRPGERSETRGATPGLNDRLVYPRFTSGRSYVSGTLHSPDPDQADAEDDQRGRFRHSGLTDRGIEDDVIVEPLRAIRDREGDIALLEAVNRREHTGQASRRQNHELFVVERRESSRQTDVEGTIERRRAAHVELGEAADARICAGDFRVQRAWWPWV